MRYAISTQPRTLLSDLPKVYDILQYFFKIFLQSEAVIGILSLKMLFCIFDNKILKNIREGLHSQRLQLIRTYV